MEETPRREINTRHGPRWKREPADRASSKVISNKFTNICAYLDALRFFALTPHANQNLALALVFALQSKQDALALSKKKDTLTAHFALELFCYFCT
jgi:hypothetical protein